MKAAGAGAVVTALGTSAATAQSGPEQADVRWSFLMDAHRCKGCLACVVACKTEYEVPLGAFRCAVKEYEYGDFPKTRRAYIPTLCNQCTKPACVRTLIGYLWGFLIIGTTLELLELLHRWYEQSEEWAMFHQLAFKKLPFTFVWGQFIVGGGVSFLLLAAAVLFPISQRLRHCLAVVASLFVLLQVFCMRWNVAIGGQLLSKTGRGFHQYHLEWFSKEGILAAIGVFLAPFVVLYILYQILPPVEREDPGESSAAGEAIETKPMGTVLA